MKIDIFVNKMVSGKVEPIVSATPLVNLWNTHYVDEFRDQVCEFLVESEYYPVMQQLGVPREVIFHLEIDAVWDIWTKKYKTFVSLKNMTLR